MARPTEYNENNPALAQKLCAEHGYSGRKLAKLFGVAPSTIKYWKDSYPEFKKAIEEGQAVHDALTVEEVEAAMIGLAVGGKVSVVKKERNKQGKLVVMSKHDRIVPANVNAGKFVLTNLASDRWKNRVDSNVNGDFNNKHELSPDLQDLYNGITGTTQDRN